MTSIIKQTFKKSKNHRLESINNLSSHTEKATDKHRKKSIHQPRKGYSKLFGKIKSKKPLNCKNPECGSRNLRYTKGSGTHAMKATCKDCGKSYWVDKDIASEIKHLVEPDPPPEKHPCRQCGRLAEAIDQWYVQCWHCGGFLTRYFGGEIDE